MSSLLVGVAWSPTALIAARVFQGAAAALMVPQVLSVVQLLYKPDERVAINGMLGGLSMLGTTLAPVLTGLLIKANIAGSRRQSAALRHRCLLRLDVHAAVAARYGSSAIHTVLTGLFITVGIAVTAGAMSKKIIPALGRWSLTVGVLIMAGGPRCGRLIADGSGLALSSLQLAPALFILGAGMGMVVVPLLPFILCSVNPDDAGSASGVASAVQQIGGALGVALIGTVFFRHLGTTASCGHAFIAGIWLQLALLGTAAVATFCLPARIVADAYEPPL